jgi:hypothetical protein
MGSLYSCALAQALYLDTNQFQPAAAWYFSSLSVVFRPAGRKTTDEQ